MTNHAHFLFRSGGAGISTLMRRLITGYAIYFNRRYRRYGQLFQNRLKKYPAAKHLGISQPGVGYAVSRGEKIAKIHKYQLHE